MIKTITTTIRFTSLIVILAYSIVLHAEQEGPEVLTLDAMIDKIVKNYASITIASIEIERSRQEFAKVESQLGWVLAAQAGLSHDVTFIDSPSDRFDAGASIGRRYESGTQFDVSGQFSHEDASVNFSPLVPNPSERARLDLNWRIPFGRGEDNPQYSQGKITAESALQAQTANQIFIIDNLIQQSINIYYDAAETYMRILDADKAIERANKLKKFIQRNMRLGLSEEKDILIVQAQVDRLIAQRDLLYIAWSRQKSEINRLTGESMRRDFIPSAEYQEISELAEFTVLLEQVYGRDPQMEFQKSQLKTAQASVMLAKDAQQDQLDVVLSVGGRAAKGDTPTGTLSQEEWAGQAKLEYQYDLDKRGFDAQLYQAMLDKQKAEEELKKLEHDIQYSVDSLVQQIHFNKRAVRSNKQRFDIENKKLQEALRRYQEGRSDTREVIEFENDLFASSLFYENQKLQLARVYANLNLLLGRVWRSEVIQTPKVSAQGKPE